ncbi:deaminase [Paractinoplanes tereljensis]|uniref:Deaminase n=2 Tax=Paractinoplanes tereljensis TaxID=571912 RepID=A0A919TP62_9ACTN|nr:deaminase [Actinoplanes tereljensis]
MSLDGFIAGEQSGVDELFGWYGNGEVAVPTAVQHLTFQVSPASADHLRPAFAGAIGALICGRRVFDETNGWGGTHPVGCPVFVVSHSVPDDKHGAFFFTDPLEALSAARKEAGDRDIAVATPSITQQFLDAGELDAIVVSLVPVLLGRGIRFFDNLATTPIRLSDPKVTEGHGVTHLTFQIM